MALSTTSKASKTSNAATPDKTEGVNPKGDKTAVTVGAELGGVGADGNKPEVIQGVDTHTGKPADEQKMNEAPQVEINPSPSNPTITKTAQETTGNKESAAHKAQRAKKAVAEGSIDREGEKTPQRTNKDGRAALVMTNVDNEKLAVTPKQWDLYGRTLIANGWVRPSWAENDGGDNVIPADIDWGRDKP